MTRRRAPRDESGFTLVELIVAMGIFTIVVSLSLVALRSMTSSTVRVTGVNDARTDVDRLYNRLDKQAPYASAVNPGAQVGASWWIEFQTSVDANGRPPTCWQYRLDTGTRTVQIRSWRPGNASTRTAWTTLLNDARVRRSGGVDVPPFRMLPADGNIARQRLVVALDVAPVGAPVVPLDTTFVARNSLSRTTGTAPSTSTATTASPTTSAGGSTLVCTEVPRT